MDKVRMDNYYVGFVDSVIIRKSWSVIFLLLTEKKAGMLVKALASFLQGEYPDIEDESLLGVYKAITEQIEESARRYVVKAGLDEE